MNKTELDILRADIAELTTIVKEHDSFARVSPIHPFDAIKDEEIGKFVSRFGEIAKDRLQPFLDQLERVAPAPLPSNIAKSVRHFAKSVTPEVFAAMCKCVNESPAQADAFAPLAAMILDEMSEEQRTALLAIFETSR